MPHKTIEKKGRTLDDVKGLIPWTENHLAWIEVHDENLRETVWAPTNKDIERLCRNYNLMDPQKILDFVANRDKNVHGIIIDAQVYRDSLLKGSNDPEFR